LLAPPAMMDVHTHGKGGQRLMARPDHCWRRSRPVTSLMILLVLAGLMSGRSSGQPPVIQLPQKIDGQAAPPAPPPPGLAVVPQAPPTGPQVAAHANVPFPMPPELVGVDLNKQSDADVAAKSTSCLQCHTTAKDPHYKNTVRIGCTDCHGGRCD